MRQRGDLFQVTDGLEARVHALAAELLPGGRREGAEWRCGSLAGEEGRSLGVHLQGSKRGVWSDFATGERGDALDLVAHALFAGDKGRAIKWAKSWLGLDRGDQQAGVAARPAADRGRSDAGDEGRETRARWALRIWLSAEPTIKGTPVHHYLEGRGIDLARLGRVPRAIRYHPALWHRESRRKRPAMVAAIVDGEGRFVAVHRTWLEEHADGKVTKAPARCEDDVGLVRGRSDPAVAWRGRQAAQGGAGRLHGGAHRGH